jgi:hypothetical protein
MIFWRLALSLSFAAFGCAAVGASLLAEFAAPLVERRTRCASPACRATALFRLRTGPIAFGAIWAFGIVLPTFLWFEPRGTMETVGRALTGTAVFGAALLLVILWRMLRAWLATRRLTDSWLRRARLVTDLGGGLRAFAVDEAFPLVAVAGVLRPRLFIAEQVLRQCSLHEVRAMIAHEAAHVRRRDNLKRLLVRVCADLRGRPWLLQEDWHEATEEAADASALAREPHLRADLAQALVRVARLAVPRDLAASASAFYLGGSIEPRIRRIMDASPFEEPQPYGCLLLSSLGAAFLVTAVAAAPALHVVVEAAVRLLP